MKGGGVRTIFFVRLAELFTSSRPTFEEVSLDSLLRPLRLKYQRPPLSLPLSLTSSETTVLELC